MYQRELGQRVTDVRMAVERTGDTVSGPSCMRHRSLTEEHLCHVDFGEIPIAIGSAVSFCRCGSSDTIGDMLSECSDFSDLLEEDDGRFWSVTIYSDSCAHDQLGWDV